MAGMRMPSPKEVGRAKGCLNFIVATMCLMLAGAAYVSYELTAIRRDGSKARAAKSHLASIIKECAFNDAKSAGKMKSLASITSLRQEINGYRIVNDIQSRRMDLSKSCFSAAAIPTDDNPDKVKLAIRYRKEGGGVSKTCLIMPSDINDGIFDDPSKVYGCKNGLWN